MGTISKLTRLTRLTRASKKVLNTEYAKLKTKYFVEQVDIDITEERLSSELMNLKVNFNILCKCESNAQEL